MTALHAARKSEGEGWAQIPFQPHTTAWSCPLPHLCCFLPPSTISGSDRICTEDSGSEGSVPAQQCSIFEVGSFWLGELGGWLKDLLLHLFVQGGKGGHRCSQEDAHVCVPAVGLVASKTYQPISLCQAQVDERCTSLVILTQSAAIWMPVGEHEELCVCQSHTLAVLSCLPAACRIGAPSSRCCSSAAGFKRQIVI